MEILNEKSALLSNFEVLSFLNELQTGKSFKKLSQVQRNLATVSYEVVKYLEKTACAAQSSEQIKAFVVKLRPFKLTKAEILTLLNHRPTTEVEIQLMVEESEERLTQEQIESLLAIIEETLPTDPIQSQATEDNLPMDTE